MYGGWLFHGDQAEYLEQMVLHDITDYAEIVEIPAAAFGAKRFFERDLHLRDVVPVPSGVQYTVPESKNKRGGVVC